jgi:hypothetical protein
MQIPVSEAFQNKRHEVTLRLDAAQIQWLKDRASDRGISEDQIVRYLLNRQMREDDGLPDDISLAGDDAEAEPEADDRSDRSTSILEDLRDASSKLDALTANRADRDDAASSGPASGSTSPSEEVPPAAAGSENDPAASSPEAGAQDATQPEPSLQDTDLGPDAPHRSRPTDFFPDELAGSEEDGEGAERSEPASTSGSQPESMFNLVEDDEPDDGE